MGLTLRGTLDDQWYYIKSSSVSEFEERDLIFTQGEYVVNVTKRKVYNIANFQHSIILETLKETQVAIETYVN